MTDKNLSADGPLAEAGDRDPPRILVVDDDPSSLTLLGEILDPRDFTVTFSTRGQEALRLAREGVDLLLLDYQLPDLDGLEVCRRLQADPVTTNLPVIFITANQDPLLEAKSLEAGAVDFVTKPYSAAVLRARLKTHMAIQHALRRLRNTHQALQKAYDALEDLASTDKLTGAWNRRRLADAVANEMERLKRYDHPLSLIILDIDFFKKINDTHGHMTGDQVLAALAALVQSSLRVTDALARWGGEEFVILTANATLPAATLMAERLRASIARTVFPTVQHLTVSLGVAECLPGEDWESWFKRADAALYRAKTQGRNQVQVAPERPERAGLGENVGAGFVQLVWHPAYESGQPLIDRQHRGLFADANGLLTAVLSARPADEVASLVDTLIQDVVQHFKDEEALLAAAGYPGTAEHAALHRQLVEKAGVLVGHFQAGTLGIGELFQFLAHDVVARHMLRADREFFPYFADPDAAPAAGAEATVQAAV